MDSSRCNHVLYASDQRSREVLHLTLECGQLGAVNGHEIKEEHCAAALDAWLRAAPDRVLAELLVTTSRFHHGFLGPVVDVLAKYRPRIRGLGLGALTFPNFARGSYIPHRPDGDGSSWHLSVPLDALLAAVPTVEELVVQCNDIETSYDFVAVKPPPPYREMPCLRRLVLRDDGLDPAVVSALAASSFLQLESLELWLGGFEYGWGASARDLVPLLRSPGFGQLRHLTLVSDVKDGLVDVLAEGPLVARLESLRLPFGVLEAAEADRLRERWEAFSHLRRLDVTGNAIGATAARALRDSAPDVVTLGAQRLWVDEEPRFAPPLVDFFDTWIESSA